MKKSFNSNSSKIFSYNFILFSVKKSFDIDELFAPWVQMSWNQSPMNPLLVKSLPKTPKSQSEAPRFGGSHNYKIKQNKLPSFIEWLDIDFFQYKARFYLWRIFATWAGESNKGLLNLFFKTSPYLEKKNLKGAKFRQCVHVGRHRMSQFFKYPTPLTLNMHPS